MLTFLNITALFILLFAAYFHPITAITQDLGRHLLTGQIIWTTHHVPKTNLFSYTYPNFPFINHHWLSEVIFYLIYQVTGFNGLLVITTIVMLIAFGFVFFYTLKQRSTNILALLASSFLYLTILFERTDVRPEIFSFLFLSLFIVLLFKNREKPTRLIYLLIPIELLWVNIHIYFFVGVSMSVLFFIDLIICRYRQFVSPERVSNRPIRNVSERIANPFRQHDVRQLGIVTVFTCFVTVLNPSGINGALYPFHVFQNYGYAIEENQNIFFLQSITNNSIIPFFELASILLFLFLIITWKKSRPIDWLLAITFSIIAVMAIRNLPLFIFATFIPFVRSLSIITHYLFDTLKKHKKNIFVIKNVLLIILLVVSLWQIITIIQSKHTGFGVITGAKNAADFYRKENIQGPVFNNFDIGSYLEYRIYPRQKVFVDGRPEAYPASFFSDVYKPMQQDPQIFQEVERKYHFNSIFFTHTDQTPWAAQIIQSILHNPQWKLIYLDDGTIILVKDTQQNKEIIEKFGMHESTVRITNFQPKSIDSLFQLAHFFNEAGWQQQELNIYQQIFAIDPNNCNALYNAIIILQQQQSPQTFLYTNRYNSYCK